VLDLGTGTGVLAIAALKLWPQARAVASDIDPVAVEVARENCRANETPSIGKYDLVLANILAKPLKQLAPEIAAHTEHGARVILSGILDEQAAEIARVYRLFGFALVRRRDLEGWATLTLSRL
jgi:ribosomal protein L11 methyltransferase